MKRVAVISGIIVVLLLVLGFMVSAQSEPLPEGKEGPEADAFARKMMEAVNSKAWDSTKVVKWTFGGSRHHVWDKTRHMAEVSWGKKRVLINLSTREGMAYKDGELQEGENKDKLLEKAWEAWVNDAFWLNPVVKVFDEGVSRRLITMKDGSEALLVSYSSGGVTPGDSYLWEIDPETFRPVSWKMWVKIIPLKGMKVGWGEWKQLPGGAWVSTVHGGKVINLKLTDIESSNSVEDLFDGKDPFSSL